MAHTLENLAQDAASALTARRSALMRSQDAAVRLAEAQAKPVKKEKRLAATMASFGMAGLDARVGPKYQIQVAPLHNWYPSADDYGDDEHAPPTLVPMETIAQELAAAEAAAGREVGSGRTQEEEEFVDDRFAFKSAPPSKSADAPAAAPPPAALPPSSATGSTAEEINAAATADAAAVRPSRDVRARGVRRLRRGGRRRGKRHAHRSPVISRRTSAWSSSRAG